MTMQAASETEAELNANSYINVGTLTAQLTLAICTGSLIVHCAVTTIYKNQTIVII